MSEHSVIGQVNAYEWYERGLQEKDYVVKFIMHWIAFNWLYSEGAPIEGEYRDENGKIRNIDDVKNRTQRESIQSNGGDKDNLRSYYKRNKTFFDPKNCGYDPFNDDAINIFVARENRPRPDRDSDVIPIVRYDDIEALLLAIYKVRCNLFHGTKSMMVERNIELVRSSSIILGKYLKIILAERIKWEEEKRQETGA